MVQQTEIGAVSAGAVGNIHVVEMAQAMRRPQTVGINVISDMMNALYQMATTILFVIEDW